MKPRLLAVLVLLLAAAAITWKLTRPSTDPQSASQSDLRTPASRPTLPAGAPDTAAAGPKTDSGAAGGSEPNSQAPAVTKATRRDTVTSPDGTRRTVIDPMASWKELPAWPEGPRLFAEVNTASHRYVNLRPNDIGLLPQLNVEPVEMLDITLQMPESTPGDTIHIELPNGGNFPDAKAMGRLLTVAANRTVNFRIEADETPGNCTVHIRQSGHTRTLPLWIGEPPAIAASDDEP